MIFIIIFTRKYAPTCKPEIIVGFIFIENGHKYKMNSR
jgi:hypothetical protein